MEATQVLNHEADVGVHAEPAAATGAGVVEATAKVDGPSALEGHLARVQGATGLGCAAGRGAIRRALVRHAAAAPGKQRLQWRTWCCMGSSKRQRMAQEGSRANGGTSAISAALADR